MAELTALLDQLTEAKPPTDDPLGRATFDELEVLRLMRNVIDHQIVVRAAELDDRHVPERHHSTLRKLLIEMGFVPAAACRYVRIAEALSSITTTTGHAADGRMSSEIVDAIVRSLDHIGKRSPDGLSDEDRAVYETELITQALSGAPPAEILTRARTLGNTIADTDGGIPAAEDRSLNTVTHKSTDDGRTAVTADLDAVVGKNSSQ